MKRIITIIIWIALTIFYVWNFADLGREKGYDTTSAIEFHLKAYNENLASVFAGEAQFQRDLNDFLSGAMYSQFHDLSKEYKETDYFVVILTVIYIIASIICYDIIFIQPRIRKMIEAQKQIVQQ